MIDLESPVTAKTKQAPMRIDAAGEWRSWLSGSNSALLLFETLTGLAIYLLPFSLFNQFGTLLHTLLGVVMLVPLGWFVLRHWLVRKQGKLSHYQLLGYFSLLLLLICILSGLLLTWQAISEPRIDYLWDRIHLFSGLAMALFIIIHLATVVIRKQGRSQAQQDMTRARHYHYKVTFYGCGLLLLATLGWATVYEEPNFSREFAADYNWRFGEDRPFAPSMARLDRPGTLDPRALAGSEGCGSAGCHQEIYQEWLPSAHRYSSKDELFQRVVDLMVEETSPEHTRYCAGCHDPISLFAGARDSGHKTLGIEGSEEGSSCLVCHSIVQTDVQGNGDYTIRPARRYVFELDSGRMAKQLSDFLIRAYPEHHINSYSRALYKTPEFCAACHKQYVDKEINTDIGKVQGQNQYDSWKNSRWNHPGEPQKTVACRECHMPLVESTDPARGDVTDYNRSLDDGQHRSHRSLASNQYIPTLQNLEGGEQHVTLTEDWLRGEIEIPEIADKWTSGPVVRMEIDAPKTVVAGEPVDLQVILTNNKTGHDFPTGPLDMLESWVELSVVDQAGKVVYSIGGLDEQGNINQTPLSYRADGFDRRGELIDRHNLWDLVGASYKRSLFPGMTDTVEARFQCPSMARGRLAENNSRQRPGVRSESFDLMAPAGGDQLKVLATLWYRKANPEFMLRVYGQENTPLSPLTWMTKAEAIIQIKARDSDAPAS